MNYTKHPLNRGYANKILNIDLGTGAITTPDLNPQVRDYFTGGAESRALSAAPGDFRYDETG